MCENLRVREVYFPIMFIFGASTQNVSDCCNAFYSVHMHELDLMCQMRVFNQKPI